MHFNDQKILSYSHKIGISHLRISYDRLFLQCAAGASTMVAVLVRTQLGHSGRHFLNWPPLAVSVALVSIIISRGDLLNID